MDFIIDRLPLPTIAKQDGIVRAVAKIARAGVQRYLENGIEYWDYRPEEEVLNLLDQCSVLPITLNHPNELVTPENYRVYNRGGVLEPAYNDGWLEASIVIHDAEAIQASYTTHKEFSIGAMADRQIAEGVWIDEIGIQGEKGREWPYNRIQKNLVLNHLSQVSDARAGSEATFIIRDGLDPNKPLNVYYNIGLSDLIVDTKEPLKMGLNNLTNEDGTLKEPAIDFGFEATPQVLDSEASQAETVVEAPVTEATPVVDATEARFTAIEDSLNQLISLVRDSQETVEPKTPETDATPAPVEDNAEETLESKFEKFQAEALKLIKDGFEASQQKQISNGLTIATTPSTVVEDSDPWAEYCSQKAYQA